eukprot:1084954-Amphidinium_carterae.1
MHAEHHHTNAQSASKVSKSTTNSAQNDQTCHLSKVCQIKVDTQDNRNWATEAFQTIAKY